MESFAHFQQIKDYHAKHVPIYKENSFDVHVNLHHAKPNLYVFMGKF
jgi:hypothetical protein